MRGVSSGADATAEWAVGHPPDDVETGYVRANGVDTYYERRGEGPAVVFVHGTFMNTAQWHPQMAALEDRYTTVAYDVRGHGNTGGSAADPYSIELFADDLHALLDALDVERSVLCGLSAGGAIAQVYAARRPENVAGLVLADTFTAGDLSRTARLFFRNLRVVGRLDRFVRYTTFNRFQLWLGNKLAPGVAGDGVTTRRIVESTPTIAHAEVVKIADAVASFPDGEFDASAITAPTLLLHGEHAPSAFRAMHERLADRLVNAAVETAVVPDAGHASNVDNPEFFTERVRVFLESVYGDGDGDGGTGRATD